MMLTKDHDDPRGETTLQSQKWYSVAEASEWLNLKIERLRKLISEGKIPARDFDGETMIHRETLRGLMDES